MSYEKIGFTSGQTLKAEHMNHIEDGIEETLVEAKEYTDSQRIAYEEKKSVTVIEGKNIPAPFTELIGLEVVNSLPGRAFLSVPTEKPSVSGVLSTDDEYLEISYSDYNGMLNKPCLLMSGFSFAAHCPIFFKDNTTYQALVYAFEEVTDTKGLGITLAKGWHAVNVNTFANEPFDPEVYPFIVSLEVIEEYTSPETVEYVKGMFRLMEKISFTVKAENLFRNGSITYVAYVDGVSTAAEAMWYEAFFFNHDDNTIKATFDGHITTITYTDSIKTVEPKFLPGVCLPVVELSTPVTTDYASMSEEDAAKFATLNGSPCILRFTVDYEGFKLTVTAPVAATIVPDSEGDYSYSCSLPFGSVMFDYTPGTGVLSQLAPVGG